MQDNCKRVQSTGFSKNLKGKLQFTLVWTFGISAAKLDLVAVSTGNEVNKVVII